MHTTSSTSGKSATWVKSVDSGEALRSVYAEHGFAVFPALLSGEEVAELNRALEEVLVGADGSPATATRFAYADGVDGAGKPYVKRVFDPIQCHDAFRRLVFHSGILNLLEDLLGPDITLQQTKINLKPPCSGAEFDWHQDYPFFPHTNFDLIAVMVFLDAVDEHNGPLMVIPGSHRLGPVRHIFSDDGQAYGTVVEDSNLYADKKQVVQLTGPCGTVAMHHCCMLHSSGANQSGHGRSTFIAEYKASDNRQIGGAMDPAGWGTQIRGADRRMVRMITGNFELPERVHLIGERAGRLLR